jgi:hypothetical protein
MSTVGNAFTVLVNGNNITIAADMVRRIIRCSLDANSESPETRVFKHNPLREVLADRGKYIAAVLTVCRAYVCQGRPGRLPALASFEAWSDLVRSALVWLGKPDPVSTIEELRATDPVREARARVFEAWVKHLGEASYPVGEVVKATRMPDETKTPAGQIVPAQEAAGGLFGLIPAQKDPKIIPAQEDPKRRELPEALLAVAADYKDPQTVNPKRLGKWLERMHKNVSGDHKLLRESSSQGHVRWQIKRMSKQGEQQHDFSAF